MRHGAHRTSMPSSAWLVGGASSTSRLVRVGSRPGLAVDAQAELLPHLEERHPLGVHGDQRARLGVAPLARLALLHDEAAEAANLDPLAARERLAHAVEDRVHHHFGVAAREAREELQYLVDQVALGHARAHWGSGPR